MIGLIVARASRRLEWTTDGARVRGTRQRESISLGNARRDKLVVVRGLINKDMAAAREAATALAIFTTGDLVAQQIEHGTASTLAPFSVERTASASALGLCWGGFISPTVYRMNEGLFPGRRPTAIAKKIGTSFILLGCCGNWGLIFCRRMLSRQTESTVPTENDTLLQQVYATARSVNRDMPTVLAHDVKVWPPTDLVVFSLVPIRLRVAFVSSVSVCWQTYLSYTASRGAPASSDSRQEPPNLSQSGDEPSRLRRRMSRPPAADAS